MERDRIIARIRKLLRLSHSANPFEAALAAERVQQMLSDYNLTMESIVDEETEAHSIRRKTRKRLEDWAYRLASRTADAFDCQYYHDMGTGETIFVGVGADPEVCGWMYSYLYRALMRLASAYLNEQDMKESSEKARREARTSFLFGAVSVVADRMCAQKKRAPITTGALVPVKESIINAAMPDGIVSRKPKRRHLQKKAKLAGQMAGMRIPLSTPLSREAACGIAG